MAVATALGMLPVAVQPLQTECARKSRSSSSGVPRPSPSVLRITTTISSGGVAVDAHRASVTPPIVCGPARAPRQRPAVVQPQSRRRRRSQGERVNARSVPSSDEVLSALVIVLAFPVAAVAAGAPACADARVSMDDAIQLALNRNQAMRGAAPRDRRVEAPIRSRPASSPIPSVSFGADGFPLFSPRQINWDFLGNVVSYSSLTELHLRARRQAAEPHHGGRRHDGRDRARACSTPSDSCDSRRSRRSSTSLLAKSTLELAQENLKSFSDVVDVNRQRVTAGDLARGRVLQDLAAEAAVRAGRLERGGGAGAGQGDAPATDRIRDRAGGLRRQRRSGVSRPTRSISKT